MTDFDTGNKKSVDVGNVWWFWFTTNAFAVDKRLRHFQRVLPRDPRCKFCNAPFQGIGGALMRVLFRKQRSTLGGGPSDFAEHMQNCVPFLFCQPTNISSGLSRVLRYSSHAA